MITIFDAEDEPHKDIYKIINTVIVQQHVEVVQSGVQLMNFRSKWFSTLNCLEYFFWFKSNLHFFSSKKVIPLGGNTVFLKRELLQKIKGWDENCLTEDADIGIRLCLTHAKIKVIYGEKYATKEETPPNLKSFIKQRTRWDQGFLQILLKGDWKKLHTISKKLMVLYIFLAPEFQGIILLYTPLSLFIIFTIKIPVLIAMLTEIPLYLLIIQLLILVIGLHEFTKNYNLQFKFKDILRTLITFFPYQVILGYSALRACVRFILNSNQWEKTNHVNAHRTINKLWKSQ